MTDKSLTDRSMTDRRRAPLLPVLLSLLCLVAAGCGPKSSGPAPGAAPSASAAGGTLKVGIIPFDNADTLKSAFTPFAQYLGKKSGYSGGEVFVTPEYSGILQALRADQIDAAYLNPLSYVLAVQQFQNTPEHLVPIGMPYFHGSLTYKGVVYVRADSGINGLKDLKGKKVAFGDVTSTSGYLYPAGMMKAAGVDPDKDLQKVNITGPAGVLAVFNKNVDAGAIFEGGIALALKDPAQQKQIKVIATTDPIPNGMIVVRGNLDPQTVDKLKAALGTINTDADGKAALKSVPSGGWDKIVPADDALFDSVRDKAKILGLSLQSLDQQKK